MGRTKPGTVQYTGAPPNSRLIGSSPHNKGILIEVVQRQEPIGQRVVGPFVLLDPGEGRYSKFLAQLLRRRFEQASELIVAIRALGAQECTHVVNRNCLKVAHEPTSNGHAPSGIAGKSGEQFSSLEMRYDVALSFAGEDRSIARQLANLLRVKSVSVFYDEYERADLWGKDLYQHLAKVYTDYSRFCVIFVSRAYAEKLWTRHELRQAQARAFRESREYLLPVRLDDTQLPGVPETIGYIDGRHVHLEDIAQALAEKLKDPSRVAGTEREPRVVDERADKKGTGAQLAPGVLRTVTLGRGIGRRQFEDPDAVDSKEALRGARELVDNDPRPSSYALAGALVAAAGLHRTAIRYLQEAIQQDDRLGTAWFNLGQAYECIGEGKRATDAFIRAMRLNRTFTVNLEKRKSELPNGVQEYLAIVSERYRELLDTRVQMMERALHSLQSAPERSDALPRVGSFELKRGSNLAEFVVHLLPDGAAVTYCHPEELRDAQIVLPFRIPAGDDFKRHEMRFMDHFGYEKLDLDQQNDDGKNPLLLLAGSMPYEKLNGPYLLRWIIRSVLFQSAGEAFLRGEPYWEVDVDQVETTAVPTT